MRSNIRVIAVVFAFAAFAADAAFGDAELEMQKMRDAIERLQEQLSKEK